MTLASGTDRIESERLILRRITDHDFGFFVSVHADADVARYIGNGLPRSTQESRSWLDNTLASYTFGRGQLAVVRKLDGTLIGRCGLSDLAVEARTNATSNPRAWFLRSQIPPGAAVNFEPELGYTFARGNWGQGFATEAAGCVFDYARRVLSLSEVTSVIHEENVRSMRVAQKLGLRRVGRVDVLTQPLVKYVWLAERLPSVQSQG